MLFLPKELWMQIFQEFSRKDLVTQLTTCRLFHSLIQIQLYEEVWISGRNLGEVDESRSMDSPAKFAQALWGRPVLFDMVRKLRLDACDTTSLMGNPESRPQENYWSHPVLWLLPQFSSLRALLLGAIHIDVDCYIAIRSIPRLEHFNAEVCDIDAALLDLGPFQGNVIPKLTIVFPKCGNGWATLVTPGLHTLSVEGNYEEEHMNEVFQGLILCDLHRTLTRLEWTMDSGFLPEFCDFLDRCAQVTILSIKFRYYPDGESEQRSSHLETLSSGSMPLLTQFRGPAEYAEVLVRGRSVHSVSLDFWDDTPTDVLRALQFSSIPVTTLEFFQGGPDDWDEDRTMPDVVLLLEYAPDTIEVMSLGQDCDLEKMQSWAPAFSRLPRLQTLRLTGYSDVLAASKIDIVKSLSETCSSLRMIIFQPEQEWRTEDDKWVRRWDDDSWEHYPVTLSGRPELM